MDNMYATPPFEPRPTGIAMSQRLRIVLVVILLALIGVSGKALAQQGDAACVKCHQDLAKQAASAEPKRFDCAKCHDPLDTAAVPHQNPGKFKKGEIAKNSASCLSCHNKSPYTKIRHGALGAGCTACHDAHSPKHGKLRNAETTAMCSACHEFKAFKPVSVHKPFAKGDCSDCHAVHESEHIGLLAEPPTELCLGCHGRLKKTPHAIAGFSGRGHPIGGEKPNLENPARPGRPFYCGSCHEPHTSKQPKLLRFDQSTPMGFCQQCHKI